MTAARDAARQVTGQLLQGAGENVGEDEVGGEQGRVVHRRLP